MTDQKPLLISVDELKLMVHKESGYRIQISDNDPLLTTIYINLAVLGAALKEAGALQNSAAQLIASLPGAADKEMKRAGDAAAVQRHTAFKKAVSIAVVGVIVCGAVFTTAGFMLAQSLASMRVTAAEKDIAQAKLQLQDANKRVDRSISDLEKKSTAEIEKIRVASGWAGTLEGRLAKEFFDLGGGLNAANCGSPNWEIVQEKNNRWCIPKRRDLFGGDSQSYGWKIP